MTLPLDNIESRLADNRFRLIYTGGHVRAYKKEEK
jgi:hypothetical protein